MGSHTETFNAHEAVCVYDKTQGIEVPFQGPESVTIDDITKDVTLNGQPVRKFEWDKAMGGTFWKFNIVGWQLLELTVPDVILDDGNGDKANFKYRLGLSYKWKSGTKGIETLLKDQGGRDPTPLLIQAARLDLKTQKGKEGAWNELLHVAGQYGMGLKKDSLGAVIVEILETTLNKAVSKEEKLELDYLKQILNQKATVQKHLFEAELAIAVSGKAAEQWAANYERVAKVKTDYMMAMNVVAKGAGGRDRASSRVAACCCCSVASKVSASIWGSGEGSGGGEGSIGIDTDFSGKLGLSQQASGEGKTEVGNKIKWSSDIETENFDPPAPAPPPPPTSGPLKTATLTVPPAPGNAVGAKLKTALAGTLVPVLPAAITSAAGEGAALALTFDTSGTVTAIFVTVPGTGYVAGNTLTVNKASYDGTHDLTITISQDNIDA
mmetsp:Transcript_18682/g.55070  ORF Transcript_18682/g.55070 Transcript_18682/m.55070 type:complete len:438 (+) Transcript_18682:72-1385(+)